MIELVHPGILLNISIWTIRIITLLNYLKNALHVGRQLRLTKPPWQPATQIFHATCTVLLSIGLNTTAIAAKPPAGLIDKFALSEMSSCKIPGMTVAVVSHGAVLFVQGYRMADISKGVRATPATVYELGSLSKQFTSAAVMVLVQEGKLHLDSSIGPILPGLKLPDSWSRLTVRQLLNQTTGLPEIFRYTDAISGGKTTPRKIVDDLRGVPLAFQPGTKFEYSNTNYYLLAQVVQSASHQEFNSFLKQRLFAPLHMRQTGTYDILTTDPLRATGYMLRSGQVKSDTPKIDSSYLTGFGGIESTAIDLAKWDNALYSNSPLWASSKRSMWSVPDLPAPETSRYGFGWVVDSDNGHTMIWHNGSLPGTTVWMGRFTDFGLTVIVLTNIQNLSAPGNGVAEIAKGLAGIFVPELTPPSLRAPSETSALDPTDVAICKKASEDVYNGRADQSMYTASTAQSLFPDAINQTRTAWTSLGSFNSFQALYQQNSGGYDKITCKLTFSSGSFVYTFVLTHDKKLIAGIMPEN